MKPKGREISALLRALRGRGYQFVTPTPATHARVIANRAGQTARDLGDVLGWNLPFTETAIDAPLLAVLRDSDLLDDDGEFLRSRVRVSTLDGDLFAHSSYPTTQNNAVFFGPDSYRFARFLRQATPTLSPRTRFVDIGAGSGVGAIVTSRITQAPAILTDINPLALNFASANWTAANPGDADFIECNGLSGVTADVDLIIANPPYIADAAHRAYRDGGGMHGGELSFTWAHQAARRLERGGAFLLYTGSAIVRGKDVLREALFDALSGFDITYEEIDPDVFGEELEREDYADVDRIAVVGLVAVKR